MPTGRKRDQQKRATRPGELSPRARRVLAEWRLLPGKPVERDPVTVASRVHRVFRDLGLEQQFTEQELTGAWRDIVGGFLADNARPGAVRRGVVEIHVVQPSLRYMLERELSGKVLARLQERFGRDRIRGLRVKIG